jgi:hypothetical protein
MEPLEDLGGWGLAPSQRRRRKGCKNNGVERRYLLRVLFQVLIA